jgi:hypothetical protein
MANEALSKGACRGAAFERRACSERLNGGADRQRRRAARFAALAFTGALFVGCLYDADDRCSPGTVLFGGTVCVCAEGSVLTDEGCLVCGENEVAGAGACVCASGFSRASEGAPCESAPSALGTACDTAASAPCTDATYTVCHVTSGTAGYCTEGCVSSAECEGGFACEATAAPSYCRRPPTGAGQTCAVDADCAGTEATLCENRMSNRCVVVCDPTASDCFPGTQCCDFTMFGAPAPFCLPDGSC